MFVHLRTDGPYTSNQSLTRPPTANFLVVVTASVLQTYNEPTMSFGSSLTKAHGGGVDYARTWIFYLHNPPAGAQTLTVSDWGGAGWALWFRGGSGSPVYGTGGSGATLQDDVTATVNTEKSGDLIVYGGAYQETGATWKNITLGSSGVTGSTLGYAYEIEDTAGSETGTFGKTGFDDRVCCYGASFKQAIAGHQLVEIW